MREILQEVATWQEPYALATIVQTWSSSPRQPGAAMALHSGGEVLGSVSVGCIEADLYIRCEEVLDSGVAEIVRYGVSDDDAFAIGLTCGGTIEIFVERVAPTQVDLARLADAVARGRPSALLTVLDGPHSGRHLIVADGEGVGSMGSLDLDEAVVDLLAQARREASNVMVTVHDRNHPASVFVQAFDPPPRLLLFGAVEFARTLGAVAKVLGYHVTVCDARPVFATAQRFPEVDEVAVAWPHDYLASTEVDERTVICVFTHDPKFDEPALEVAVQTTAGYIGVMGSRRTHHDRLERLRQRGLSDDQLARLSSPVGLDLGGHSPAETAISIMAEVIAKKWGGSGHPLSDTKGRIHRRTSAEAVATPSQSRSLST